MRTGKTVQELAKELTHIHENSHDFIAPLGKLTMEVMDNTPVMTMEGDVIKQFTPTAWANQQISTYTKIPKNYFDRIHSESADLITRMINHGLDEALKQDKNASRMVRTIGNDARALLSPRYRRLDCYDLLNEIFPLLLENHLKVESCEMTDRRLYIKAVSERLTDYVKVGDDVQYGLVISSSDVGCGSVRVEPLIYRLACLNGMISNTAMRKYHVGKLQAGDGNMEVLSDETKAMSDAAFWSACKDTVIHSLKEDVFKAEVDKLKEAAGIKIESVDLKQVVELTSKELNVTNEETKKSVLANLCNGADGAGLTKWGLANAFTASAKSEALTYDAATELERVGGKVIELDSKTWNKIAA
jgi:hypothetical protein